MTTKHLVNFLILLLFFTLDAFAIEGKVRVFTKTNDVVYTSQKVTIAIEILTTAFSTTDVKITFPPSDKYIVQAPKSAAYLGRDEIEREEWQLVHYEYALYPLKAGKIVIPTILVSFTSSMGYGQAKKEFSLKSDRLSIDVQSPQGIKNNQFTLVTDKYSVASKMTAVKKQIFVGDAIELSITQKAHDVLDILLKPINYSSNENMRVYKKEPELQSNLKGDYDVSRVDRFTFVTTGEGNVTLPEKELFWWNPVTQKLHTEKIPQMQLEIIEDPQIALDAKKKLRNERLMYVGLLLGVLLVLFLLFKNKIKQRIEAKKRQYEESEKGKFEHLLSTVAEGNLSEVYKSYYAWLGVAGSKDTIDEFVEENVVLKKGLSDFEASLVGEKAFDATVFKETLHLLRAMFLQKKQKSVEGLAQKLNPN